MFKNIKILIILLCVCVCCSACNKEEAGILFNSQPITKDTALNSGRTFEAGKKVYFLFYTPKELKTEFIRVHIFTAGDNIPKGGYNIIWTKDFRIMKNNHYYYHDCFVIHKAGRYVMQVFDIHDLSQPLAWNYFYLY